MPGAGRRHTVSSVDRGNEIRAWASEVYDPSDPARMDFTTTEEAAFGAFKESIRVIKSTLGSWWLRARADRFGQGSG